jgi:hypothetical protein
MNNKKRAFFIFIGILILFSWNTFAETKKLREVGRFKFIDTNMPVEQWMKTIAEKYAEDVKIGFALAGYGDAYSPFMDQVKQSAFEERTLPVGGIMKWMVFRSQGKVKLVQDLEWAGANPLPVLYFAFEAGNMNYEFAVPKTCGNIALLSMEPVMPQPGREGEPAMQQDRQDRQEQQDSQDEIQRARIYDEIYDLLSEIDLYCSFRIHSGDLPDMKIIGADRETERGIYSDGDLMYVDKGRADGLEEGQLFQVLHITSRRAWDKNYEFENYGNLAFKQGRVRIVDMAEHKSTAVLENCCDPVSIGSYLVPFEPDESLLGKDLGFDVPPFKADGVSGRVIFIQADLNQIGSGHWALINMGARDDLHRGQQLLLYRELHVDAPLQIYGNLVVIDVQEETATVKVLSCRDALNMGDLVMLRPTR